MTINRSQEIGPDFPNPRDVFPIIQIDAHGFIREANPLLYSLSRLQDFEVINQPVTKFLKNTTPNAVFDLFKKSLRSAHNNSQPIHERTFMDDPHTTIVLLNGKEYSVLITPAFSPVPPDSNEMQHPQRFSGFTLALHNATELAALGFYDELTGLPNRRFYYESTRHMLAHAQREKESIAICIMDVDQFKKINDTYGHLAGDMALQTMAGALQNYIRVADIVARFAGDEFIVTLAQPSYQDIFHTFNRLRMEIQSLQVPSSKGNFSIRSSFGVVYYEASELGRLPMSPDLIDSAMSNIINQADVALYWVKNNNPGAICLNVNHAMSMDTLEHVED